MAKFREKLKKFAGGRYGIDQLYYFITAVALVLMVVYLIVRQWWLYPIILALLVWSMFRSFSRNTSRRYRENRIFLGVCRSVGGFFKLNWNRIRFIRSKVFKKCPHCRAVLRLPRRKGSHSVRCPRCGRTFDVKVAWGKK